MEETINTFFKNNFQLNVNGSLWLESDGEPFFGPGPVELLERIEATGSISAAAKEMKMSYKKAWALVNTLNAQTTMPMVVPQAGGEKGGGSTITSEARELIEYHRALRERFTAFLAHETQNLQK